MQTAFVTFLYVVSYFARISALPLAVLKILMEVRLTVGIHTVDNREEAQDV